MLVHLQNEDNDVCLRASLKAERAVGEVPGCTRCAVMITAKNTSPDVFFPEGQCAIVLGSGLSQTVLVRLSSAVIEHHNRKQFEKERVYFSLYMPITVHHRGKSGQGLEVRIWRQELMQRPREGPAYLACISRPASLFSYAIQD